MTENPVGVEDCPLLLAEAVLVAAVDSGRVGAGGGGVLGGRRRRRQNVGVVH